MQALWPVPLSFLTLSHYFLFGGRWNVLFIIQSLTSTQRAQQTRPSWAMAASGWDSFTWVARFHFNNCTKNEFILKFLMATIIKWVSSTQAGCKNTFMLELGDLVDCAELLCMYVLANGLTVLLFKAIILRFATFQSVWLLVFLFYSFIYFFLP